MPRTCGACTPVNGGCVQLCRGYSLTVGYPVCPCSQGDWLSGLLWAGSMGGAKSQERARNGESQRKLAFGIKA